MLSQPARLLWLVINLVGQLLGFAFWIWVERNASLPYLPIELGWPWVDFASWGTFERSFFDFMLFVIGFGLVHSLLAQAPAQRAIARFVPPQAVRSFYILVTGLCLLLVMSCWQHTGVVLWVLPLHYNALQIVSVLAFWSMMIVPFIIVRHFDTLEFAGFRQLYADEKNLNHSGGNPKLVDTGIYAWVRHPIYLFTLLAFWLAPMMTLDRLMVTLAAMAYLSVAIPVEEKKLVQIFGRAYEDYRRRVPAVIPFLKR